MILKQKRYNIISFDEAKNRLDKQEEDRIVNAIVRYAKTKKW